MKKAIKVIGFILVQLLVIAGCVWMGGYINGSAEEKELLTINKIALVNLDDGIEVNGEHKYYGTEFINKLDDNFEIMSLEQARRGLENNLYAAYIIIPAVFSKNIESINIEPIKSNIIYKINPNLDYGIREQIVADIWAFNENLSTDIEYVYIDAILKEVHTVQDGAGELLENDLKDLQAVLQFTETSLVVDPEFPNQSHVDNTIARLDFSKIYSDMQTVFSDLSTEYKSSEASAQQEYDKLISGMTDVSSKMGELNAEIGGMADIDEGEEFDIENDGEIRKYISDYNADLSEWKDDYDKQAAYNFDEYMDKCQKYTNEQLTNLNMDQKQQLKNFYILAYDECNIVVESESKFDNEITSLNIYSTARDIINELKGEIANLNNKIDDLYAATADSGVIIGDITSEVILNKTFDDVLIGALSTDISRIGEMSQMERNAKLKESITNWLKAELNYYGVSDELTSQLDPEKIEATEAIELIDDWYTTEVNLSIEPVEEKEDSTEESEIETDDDKSGELDNDEKSEEQIKLEKRANVLFANTYEPDFVDADALDSLITGTVISPISGSIMKKYTDLTASYTALDTVWSDWNMKLGTFTINSFGDEKKRGSFEKSFYGNMQKIQNEVDKKSAEYEAYVTQSNEVNDNNLENWEKSIQNANKETHTNIDNGIESIKSNREQMNASNNDLMANILNILPYSRIGELENRNVYSYIASPIAQEDLSENRVVDFTEPKGDKDIDNNRMQLVTILCSIILCVTGGSILIMQMRKKNKYLQKQDL